MKPRTTVFLALLLVSLSTYYVISERNARRAEAQLASIKILPLAEGDRVSWFRIENGTSKEALALRREDSEWTLEFPVVYPAERFLAEGIASALTLSYRLRRFPFEEKEAVSFGLEPAEIRVELETEKDPKRRTLLLGKESPMKMGIYARWEGEAEAFLMPAPVKAALERTVYSLRQKKLFRLDPDQVTWIHAKRGAKEFRSEEIPVEKIDDLIYALQSLYIKEFLDGKDPATPAFGLQGKRSFVAAGTSDGTVEKIYWGAAVREKQALHAIRENERLVLLVPQQKVASLYEMVETLVQEQGTEGDVDSSSTQGNRGTDPTGGGAGSEESGPDSSGVGDEERAGRADSRGV